MDDFESAKVRKLRGIRDAIEIPPDPCDDCDGDGWIVCFSLGHVSGRRSCKTCLGRNVKIQIKTWWGDSLYECEAEDLRGAVEKAVSVGASLDDANLVGARLDGARLDGASLVGANLDRANLVGANLDGASLVGARLVDARLDGASLVDARLDGASLVGARLVDGRTILEWIADPLAGLCDDPEATKRAIEAWGSHTWKDCPLHAGNGWNDLGDAAEDKRLLAACFVALFDSQLLPKPVMRESG